MEMYRSKIDELVAWKNDKNRKPLILKGARQVGKTWLMKEFGCKYYQNTFRNHQDAMKNKLSLFLVYCNCFSF